MKHIKINSLRLQNFKKAKDKTIELGDITIIQGQNATGKSTVYDAFLWLLFGKDSHDRKDTDIKTYNESGEVLNGLEHKVTGVFNDFTATRMLKEKWTKRRGSEEKEFTGHITEFTFNDVPCLKKEYDQKISNIIDEETFRMITDVYYFNNMPWKEKRDLLVSMAGGESSDKEVAEGTKFEKLHESLSGKTIEEEKARLKVAIKKVLEKKDSIPTRIDEQSKHLPEAQPDYTELEKKKEELVAEVDKVEKAMESKLKAAEQAEEKSLENQRQIYAKKKAIEQLKQNAEIESSKGNSGYEEKLVKSESNYRAAKRKRESIQQEIIDIEADISKLDDKKESFLAEIAEKETKMGSLRKEFEEIKEKAPDFQEIMTECYACGRPFEESDISEKKEEAKQNFNKNKVEKMSEIKKKGQKLSVEVNALKEQIIAVEEKQAQLKVTKDERFADFEKAEVSEKKAIESFNKLKENKPEAKSIDTEAIPEVKALRKEIAAMEEITFDVPDVSEFSVAKKELQKQLHDINTDLQAKVFIDEKQERIKELKAEGKKLSKQYADLQKELDQVEEFENYKVQVNESKVNKMFDTIKFRMFKRLINGGTEPICEAIIGGVPYQSANTGAKINAGIEIINTISKYKGIVAPIFVDNAESVTSWTDTPAQLIMLRAKEGQKELKVTHI